jgi:hypothetical protein
MRCSVSTARSGPERLVRLESDNLRQPLSGLPPRRPLTPGGVWRAAQVCSGVFPASIRFPGRDDWDGRSRRELRPPATSPAAPVVQVMKPLYVQTQPSRAGRKQSGHEERAAVMPRTVAVPRQPRPSEHQSQRPNRPSGEAAATCFSVRSRSKRGLFVRLGGHHVFPLAAWPSYRGGMASRERRWVELATAFPALWHSEGRCGCVSHRRPFVFYPGSFGMARITRFVLDINGMDRPPPAMFFHRFLSHPACASVPVRLCGSLYSPGPVLFDVPRIVHAGIPARWLVRALRSPAAPLTAESDEPLCLRVGCHRWSYP